MSTNTKAYGALLFICIVWGTTYLAIKILVEVYPALLAAGVRQVFSGLVIGAIALSINRRTDLSRLHIARQALIGTLMIAVGNGLVSWSQKSIPSGVAAMVCATMPIWAVGLGLLLSRKERINGLIAAGMALGLAGVALIVATKPADASRPAASTTAAVWGIALTLLATMGWAAGSVFSRRWKRDANPLFDAGVQVVAGGIVLLIASMFAEDHSAPFRADPRALWSFGYLVVFGSVLAYTFYQYALKHLPVGVATLYAYVNPLVAVVLGYFAGEGASGWTAVSFAGIVGGVYLVNRGYRRQQAALSDTE